MLKKILLLLVVVVFASMSGFAQDKGSIKEQHRIVPNENYQAPVEKSVVPFVQKQFEVCSPATGDTIGITNYDNFSNSVIRPQITWYNGKPAFSPMIRVASATNRRHVDYIVPNNGVYVAKSAFDTLAASGGNSGWPQIDIARTGDAVGTPVLTAHHVQGAAGTFTEIAIYDEQSGTFTPATFGAAGTDPSVLWMGNNLFLANSGNRLLFRMFKSTDFGGTFTNFDSITHYSPLPMFWTDNGGVEVGMAKSINEKNIMYFGTNTGAGANYSGIPVDSCDNAWILLSTNAGSTFKPTRIGEDGRFGIVSNAPGLAPLFENFGQLSGAVDTLGTAHLVVNGYGVGIYGTDTTNTSPILYYNSKDAKWSWISDVRLDTASIATTTGKYPGNGIGQSFPGVACSGDGKFVFVTWTGAQYHGALYTTPIDTSDIGIFYTDIYYTYSYDGGKTWKPVQVLAGAKNVSETYGQPAPFVEVSGGNFIAHVLYLADPIPGASVFASNGAAANCALVYKTVTIPAVGVEDNSAMVNKFSLEQNYPNPFNPTTNIKFNLAKSGNVTLRVYDMLGREVSTLVNGFMTEGQQNVSFNASKLASGMYMYKLEAGNQVAIKKMLLVK